MVGLSNGVNGVGGELARGARELVSRGQYDPQVSFETFSELLKPLGRSSTSDIQKAESGEGAFGRKLAGRLMPRSSGRVQSPRRQRMSSGARLSMCARGERGL
jgi:hypothetical protein